MHPRYKDLKEEMRNYEYLPYGQTDEIIIKANAYLITNTAKSMKAKWPWDTAIKLDNLISIILYCDYSDLSTDFTLSFRKAHQFQILKQIKHENSRYAHWANTLYRTVRKFGQNYFEGLRGPFYCGMSIILKITQFHMLINSPLSTSVHREIGQKFSGEEGMILALDNSKGDARFLKGLDVSWIARYKERDERYVYFLYIPLMTFLSVFAISYRLFFGCNHGRFGAKCPINISGMIDFKTTSNFTQMTEAIKSFDNIISGDESAAKKINRKAYFIISESISKEKKNKLHPLMYHTFKLFMDRKKEVTLSMNNIYDCIKNVKFLELLFGGRGLAQFEYDKNKSNNYFIPSDDTNIPIIINKFSNIHKITIIDTQFGYKYYSLSLVSLLSLLEQKSTITQIKILINRKASDMTNWISFVFQSDQYSLKEQYRNEGFSIEYRTEDKSKGKSATILINKL